MKDKKRTFGFYNWVIEEVQKRVNKKLTEQSNRLLTFKEVALVMGKYSDVYCEEYKAKFKKIHGSDLVVLPKKQAPIN